MQTRPMKILNWAVPQRHARRAFFRSCFAALFMMLNSAAFAADFHNLPVCRANGDQSAPLLIAGGSEGAFVLWLDQRTSQRKVFCQRLNQPGQPQWQADGVEIASTPGKHEFFAALPDGNGGVIIVWQEAIGSDDGEIFAQRLNHEGARLWGDNGKEIYRGSREQILPAIVSDGAGGAIILWQDERAGSWDIFAQRVNANGDRLWHASGVALVQETRSQLLGDAVAISDQGFCAAWRDERTNPARVLVQRFDANGTKVWNEAVGVAQALGDQSQPQLGLDAGNAAGSFIYIAWSDRRLNIPNVYAQRLSAAGLLQWGSLGIAAGRGLAEQKEMQLLVESNGDLILAWEDGRNDKGDIYAQRLGRDGRGQWPAAGLAVLQAEQGQYRPRLASEGNSGWVCTWEDDRGSGTNIAAQRVDAAGKLLWPAEGVLLTNHGDKTFAPIVLGRAAGQALVAWTDTRQRSDDIYAQPLAAGGNFENVPPIISSTPPVAAYVNAEYKYSITSVDFDSDETPMLVLSAAPAWLQLDQNQKTLGGIPRENDRGEFDLALQARDAEGGLATQNFTLKVLPDPAAAPRIISLPDTTAAEDSPYRYVVQARDPDPQEVLQYNLETAAAWLSLSPTGELGGAPLNEHVGIHAVKITVTNRKGKSDQQQFFLKVLNTNDPPVFTSVPDTIARVDSLYQYQVLTQEVDAGDRVALTLLQAPAWLSWDASSKTLRGAPRLQHVGIHAVAFRAQDLAQAATTQQFAVRVYNSGEPDGTAPAAPQNANLTPATWSRAPNFTVRWQNPFDRSGIAGAFYKIGAPPDSNGDGKYMPASPSPSITEIKLQATQQGRLPVYVWLRDGSGNVDYRTAVRVDYRYDASAPRPAANLRAGNAFAWANTDTIIFAWQAASDSLSGVARHDLMLAGKIIRRMSGNVNTFALDTLLAEKKYAWQINAVDSAGNLAASISASFRVDCTAPVVTHAPVDTAEAGKILNVRATARDALAGIARVRVLYRTAGGSHFSELSMSAASAEFAVAIPGAEIQSPGLQYVILAEDSAGNVARSTKNANPAGVHAAVVKSQQIIARTATRGEYYQLISIPYRLRDHSPAAVFADNLGAYDPARWRLYTYSPAHGNVELGQAEFQQLEPGRAHWLISAQPQNFDAGPGVSIATAQAFTLALQPGWNLIAAPFDFPLDWNAVQKPPMVENQLWAFDGKQYLANDNVMQPWQGYFVRNLSDQLQALVFPPPCADCMPGSSLNQSDVDATPAPRAFAEYSFRHCERSEAISEWSLQLRLRGEEFADTQNWLGMSAQAREEWDELELSEPPAAAGEFVALRFPQPFWKKFAGNFTTDFRPARAALQKMGMRNSGECARQSIVFGFSACG